MTTAGMKRERALKKEVAKMKEELMELETELFFTELRNKMPLGEKPA